MAFEEWNDEFWKVKCKDEDCYELTVPGTRFIFNKHDFIQLQKNILAVDIFAKEVYYIHDNNIHNRVTGEQLIGIAEDCVELNKLYVQNQLLEEEIVKEQEEYNYLKSLLLYLSSEIEINEEHADVHIKIPREKYNHYMQLLKEQL